MVSNVLTVENLKHIKKEQTLTENFKGDNFDILPCQGIYKLSTQNDPVSFTYCQSEYWKCPNASCIMQLV